VRLHIISDLHGATWHLAEAGRDCDALLILGDLINVLDYHTMDGILVEIFGRDSVAEAAEHRARGRYDEARSAMRRTHLDETEVRSEFVEKARAQYEQVFDALPDNSFVTYGNVDIPDMLRMFERPGVRVVDGEVLDLGGERIGMVGGGMRTPLHVPGEVDDDEYDRKLEGLGAVDVICTHQPPRIPWLVYDLLGKRFEPGSTGLVAYIQRYGPRRSYFGHVHQPLIDRMTIGHTELINVGHFRATGKPFVHETAA
jgi:Icc-related predicted phosphoesterase